jgi:hypothetical protein
MEGAMIVAKIVLFQILLLILLLICTSIAGEKNGMLWFIVITLTIGALTLARKIAQTRR